MKHHHTIGALVAAFALTAIGCGGDSAPNDAVWRNLAPVANSNVEAAAQPSRLNPFAVDVTHDGRTALVALRGSELEPGRSIVVVDIPGRRARASITVGARPIAVRIHPAGRFAIVLSQLSPLASVIDLDTLAVTGTIEVGYYATDLTFNNIGTAMFVSNRASNDVTAWALGQADGTLKGTRGASAPAGVSPDAVALSTDGVKLYVTDAGGLGVNVFDSASLQHTTFISFNAPVFDIQPMGNWLVASTLNDTNGLPCDDDSDYGGVQGDGIYPIVTDRTCSRGFADIQNEIAFIDTASDQIAIRFTSDTAEISEADREGDHDPALMQVKGALPQSIAVVDDDTAYVTMGASDELVELVIDGGSPPSMVMPRAFATGFAPQGVAIANGLAIVADMLGETVSIISLADGTTDKIVVGNDDPPFPATSAEVGELFAHSAKFSTDGDQACVHCHPNNHTDGKTWGVGIVRAFGRRAALPLRNLHDTLPLLVEGVFDSLDFSLEMEAMSLRQDFHDSSYTLQVKRRDVFYRETSMNLIGLEIGFDEMVKHVGAFLLIEPRLLPSPFDGASEVAERGRALFERPDVGCASCHPAPTFASEDLFEGVTTLGRYDLPRRDLDPDISIKYIENARDGFFNANSLRGLWDRPGVLLHDGRARTVRETILTPGHPCLGDDERAFNEFDDQVDTNGGISHLSCEQIDELVTYLMTIN